MAFQSAAAGISAVPIFSPAAPSPTRRSPSELRFSRWNNAPARELARRLRPQQEIEEDIRRERRFRSAIAIAEDSPDAADHLPSPRSAGTPSVPSRSSIPGRASKYSKPPKPDKPSHPAFRRLPRIFDRPEFSPEVTVSDAGVAYRVPNAPFEFQYSYTETPKVKPLKLREPAVTPFGPMTMSRPWTGRRPLPGTKKLLPEFDSFRPPPPDKKGVKSVQAPGPYLAGSGPRHAMSREEILGEPLTKEEIEDLIKGSLKIRRQLNMGRDGLTHNMLDNIHALWKRRRVCKIKCKGVCTVDMDNVREQLEDKTGGKIIYSRGGVIFLFRGRNYNYKTRPKYPLMLWKPAAPVYPRLVKRVPEGLSLEEATEMRSKGRKLPAICKLGKNGVYCDLVNNVREAFEECELVRINCQGMNKSDYKKIGAKLKDLVPCVLISFEEEHILMWRGRDWKSSFLKDSTHSTADSGPLNLFNESTDSSLEREELSCNNAWSSLVTDESSTINIVSDESTNLEQGEGLSCIGKDNQYLKTIEGEPYEVQTGSAVSIDGDHCLDVESIVLDFSSEDQYHRSVTNEAGFTEEDVDTSHIIRETIDDKSVASDISLEEQFHASAIELNADTSNIRRDNQLLESMKIDELNRVSENHREDASNLVSQVAGEENVDKITQQNKIYTEALLLLLQGAIDSGRAVVLEQNEYMDANVVYEKSVDLAKTAPPWPTLKQKARNLPVHKNKEREKPKEVQFVFAEPLTNQCSIEKPQSSGRPTNDDFTIDSDFFVEQGSLGVDELAKLLA